MDYCQWINGVLESIESYNHDETLEAEIKLKDYENSLLPEKLALEASDKKTARKIIEMECMLKGTLVDRLIRMPSTRDTCKKIKKSSKK